jgi:hypothetical protein
MNIYHYFEKKKDTKVWIGLTWLRIKTGILNKLEYGGSGETHLVENKNLYLTQMENRRVWIGLIWLRIEIDI